MRPFRVLLALALASVLVVAVAASPAAVASSAKPTKCTPPATFPEAGGKFTSLTALKTTCKTASSLATSVAKCQAANGKGGRCVKKVSGYACQEVRTTAGSIATAKVKCVKKSVVVTFGETRQL